MCFLGVLWFKLKLKLTIKMITNYKFPKLVSIVSSFALVMSMVGPLAVPSKTWAQIVPSGILTPVSSSCIIASGQSACDINFSWTTINPVGSFVSAVTKNPNITVAEGNDGTDVPFSVKHDSETFFLYAWDGENSVELDQETVTSSCAEGTSWDGEMCSPSSEPQVCTDENANNLGQPLPCTYDEVPSVCTDDQANNEGEPLPCTYNSNEDNGGGGGGGGGNARCSNHRDDEGDGLIDSADPQCHSDGNPNNPSSYVPSDNSESDGSVVNAQGEVLGAFTTVNQDQIKTIKAQLIILIPQLITLLQAELDAKQQ